MKLNKLSIVLAILLVTDSLSISKPTHLTPEEQIFGNQDQGVPISIKLRVGSVHEILGRDGWYGEGIGAIGFGNY